MAQLQFKVKNQSVTRVDSFNPASGSQNYLYAHFDFETGEWANKIVTAIFRNDGNAYEVILDADNECEVPHEVLESEDHYVNISVFTDGGTLVTTTNATVFIAPSGYDDDLESSTEPTPSVYGQILDKIQENKDYIDEKITHIDGGLFTDWD